jgi:hypothetical protein
VDDRRLLAMQVHQRLEQLIGPTQHLRDWEWPRLADQQRRQVIAGDKLHHQELPGRISEEVADPRQRRVPQARQQPGLALEGFVDLGSPRQQALEGHPVAEAGIDRLVDRAHTALP